MTIYPVLHKNISDEKAEEVLLQTGEIPEEEAFSLPWVYPRYLAQCQRALGAQGMKIGQPDAEKG